MENAPCMDAWVVDEVIAIEILENNPHLQLSIASSGIERRLYEDSDQGQGLNDYKESVNFWVFSENVLIVHHVIR